MNIPTAAGANLRTSRLPVIPPKVHNIAYLAINWLIMYCSSILPGLSVVTRVLSVVTLAISLGHAKLILCFSDPAGVSFPDNQEKNKIF